MDTHINFYKPNNPILSHSLVKSRFKKQSNATMSKKMRFSKIFQNPNHINLKSKFKRGRNNLNNIKHKSPDFRSLDARQPMSSFMLNMTKKDSNILPSITSDNRLSKQHSPIKLNTANRGFRKIRSHYPHKSPIPQRSPISMEQRQISSPQPNLKARSNMKRMETGAVNQSRNREAFSPNVNNRNQKLLHSGTICVDTPSNKKFNNLLMSYDVKNSTVVNQANNRRIKQNMLSIEYSFNNPKVVQNEPFQSLKSSNNDFVKRVKRKTCKRKNTNNLSN